MRAFTYGIDEVRTLRVLRQGEELRADVLTRSLETRTEVVAGTIRTSLFGAVEAAGEGDQLALDLADIYAWDVDFNTEIQPGDSFRVAVEKHLADGALVRYGRILAAEFVRGERVLRAIRHEGAAGAGYYDPDRRPLRKAFLRSPLRFTRISSRFTRSRLHPILQVRRAHLGVDYAAPAGTPVSAAADGVVTTAGWLGGYGRTVKVRHANGYETLYGHLSRIDVRRGQRVAQGDRDRRGRRDRNRHGPAPRLPHEPERPVRGSAAPGVPPAEPVPAGERAAFDEALRRAVALLGPTATPSAPPPGSPRAFTPPAPGRTLIS